MSWTEPVPLGKKLAKEPDFALDIAPRMKTTQCTFSTNQPSRRLTRSGLVVGWCLESASGFTCTGTTRAQRSDRPAGRHGRNTRGRKHGMSHG